MKTLSRCSFEISSDINNVCTAIVKAKSFLKDSFGKINEDVLFELRVVLYEILLNAVKHGNNCDSNKLVRISVGLTSDDFAYFIIEDEGDGYDYRMVAAQGKKANDVSDAHKMKETGRGILIVRNLCDEVRYNNKGNKIVIMKKLTNI